MEIYFRDNRLLDKFRIMGHQNNMAIYNPTELAVVLAVKRSYQKL